MSMTSFDIDALRHLLPEPILGEVTEITPIHMGLSGAGVYAVTSERGEYILRVQGKRAKELVFSWDQQLLVLRRAAGHGIAPAIVHVDHAERAVISARIAGVPLHMALADPAQRDRVIGSVVAQLRALHALDSSGLETRDAIAYARGVWEIERDRGSLPDWAMGTGEALDAIADLLERDTRRVFSHNDINPGNVLWDGTRAWLIDWEAGGLMHPYYDIAALSTFLNLDREAAWGLLAMQEQGPLGDDDRAAFAAMSQLVALFAGCVFLRLVPSPSASPTLADAPTLTTFYADIRTGKLTLQTPEGLTAFGLALLRRGIEQALPV